MSVHTFKLLTIESMILEVKGNVGNRIIENPNRSKPTEILRTAENIRRLQLASEKDIFRAANVDLMPRKLIAQFGFGEV